MEGLRRSTLACAAILLASVTSRTARAQSAPPVDGGATSADASVGTAENESATQAEALVAQGIQLRRASQDQQALLLFRQAFALVPSPRTRAQIALAEQALGQWAQAEVDLRAALAEREDPWIQRNVEALDAALTAITAHLGSLEVTSSVAGATLWVNGREVGPLPLAAPARIETGTTQIEVRRSGYNTGRRTIEIEPGRSYRESFNLVIISADPVIQRVQGPVRVINVTEEYIAPRASVPLVIAGGVAVLGGVGAHVFWQNRVSVYNSGSPSSASNAGSCYDPTEQYPSRLARCGAVLGESWAGFGLMVTGYVLGGAALATGVALRFVGGERRVREVGPARSGARASAASLQCFPLLTVAGATCAVQF
ncbi:MAG: PEGA domain-containing protein [Myxococcales bacterium]|nr:PEGA domain-containing protein [Myxococcales bacterium]